MLYVPAAAIWHQRAICNVSIMVLEQLDLLINMFSIFINKVNNHLLNERNGAVIMAIGQGTLYRSRLVLSTFMLADPMLSVISGCGGR